VVLVLSELLVFVFETEGTGAADEGPVVAEEWEGMAMRIEALTVAAVCIPFADTAVSTHTSILM
jgi:hypothetical protein